MAGSLSSFATDLASTPFLTLPPSLDTVSQTLEFFVNDIFLGKQLHTFRFEKEGQTPFSSVWCPTLGALAYVLMVTALPALLRILKSSAPSRVVAVVSTRPLEIVHNCVMIVLSVCLTIGSALAIWQRIADDGGLWNGFLCSQRHILGTENLLDGPAGFWIYVYHLSKYYELVDTLILILKQKDLIFLHMWHHGSMLFVTFSWLYFPLLEGSLWCVFINSVIHTFMYTYYLLCVLDTEGRGKNIWWKRYLTQGQIVQFWTGMFVCACFLGAKLVYGDQACAGHTGSCLLSVGVNITFIMLFSRFYKKSYKPKTKKMD